MTSISHDEEYIWSNMTIFVLLTGRCLQYVQVVLFVLATIVLVKTHMNPKHAHLKHYLSNMCFI